MRGCQFTGWPDQIAVSVQSQALPRLRIPPESMCPTVYPMVSVVVVGYVDVKHVTEMGQPTAEITHQVGALKLAVDVATHR